MSRNAAIIVSNFETEISKESPILQTRFSETRSTRGIFNFYLLINLVKAILLNIVHEFFRKTMFHSINIFMFEQNFKCKLGSH